MNQGKLRSKAPHLLLLTCVLATAAITIFFIAFIFKTALPIFESEGIGFITGTKWSYSEQVYGIRIFIIGTLVMTAVTLLLAVPVSVFTAIFLSEFAPVRVAAHWHSVNATIMNLNTDDSHITAISLNGMHAMNYRAKDASGNLDYYREYPVGYNFKKRVMVPTAGSKEICLNFTGTVINTSEDGNITFTGWTNNSDDYIYPLPKNPRVAYPYVLYPDMVYSATVKNVTGGNVIATPSGNYIMDDITGNITLLGTGSMTNTSSYNIAYTTRFETFTPPLPVSKSDPLTIEVITSLINIFKRTFMPPVPLAEVQFETERLVDGDNVSYRDYLILDASESFDPDGFITEYRWAVWDNSTSIYDYNNLTGMKVRPVKLNLTTCQNVEIDLEVRDDTGMISRLSQRSGNITIP